METYLNIIGHGGITVGGSSSSSFSTAGRRLEVVSHLRVQLLLSLLGRSGAAATALLLRSLSSGIALVVVCIVVLVDSSRLGLGLGLTEATLMLVCVRRD